MKLPIQAQPITREISATKNIKVFNNVQQQGFDDVSPKLITSCFSKFIVGGAACLWAIRSKNKGEFNKQCRDKLIEAGGDCAKIVQQIGK